MPAVTAGPPPATVEAAVRGDLVWAKIYGFPWWPSQVRSNKQLHDAEPKVRVRFLFTNDNATLPLEQLCLWADREPQEKLQIKSKVCVTATLGP